MTLSHSPLGMSSQRNHQADLGGVLVEFALTFPLVLLIAASMIDVWLLVRDSEMMLAATRYGARAASAKARDIAFSDDDRRLSLACEDATGRSPVLDTAVSLAFQHLVMSGLDKGNCTLSGISKRECTGSSYKTVAQFEDLCEGDAAARVIRVTVISQGVWNCLFCLPQFSGLTLRDASSIFAVEVDCSALEPLTCP